MSNTVLTKEVTSTNYTDLPSEADGTWVGPAGAVFIVSNSEMTLGASTFHIKYDSSTGYLYMNPYGNYTLMSGYSWNGSAFTMSNTVLTKE